MIRLIYVVQSEVFTGGVIESQVVAAGRARSNLPCHPTAQIVFLESHRNFRTRALANVMNEYRSMWPTGMMTVVPFVGRWPRSTGLALRASLTFPLTVTLGNRRPSDSQIFHARGPEATITAHAARRRLRASRLVFDVRGHGPYEALSRLKRAKPTASKAERRHVYEYALERDRIAARVADHVVAVSPGLCRYVIEDLGKDPNEVTEIPNGVERLTFSEQSRTQWRRTWGIERDAPVVIYSGRIGPERCPDLMVATFRSVAQRIPGARLVILTYLDETIGFKETLERNGIDPSTVTFASLSHAESLDALSVGDIGLLLLADDPRYNEFASPIKFAEYLSAGLRVAVTPGELAQVVAREELGWVVARSRDETEVPEVGRIDEFEQLADIDFAAELAPVRRGQARDRALAYCEKKYLWSSNAKQIFRAYGLQVSDR